MQFTLPRLDNPLKYFFRNNRATFQEKQENVEPKISEQNIINETERNYMEDGCDIRWEDTQEFTFPIKGGRVIKVYDADTITIASKLPYDKSPLYRLSVRLNGIDTPEMKGNDVTNEEKEAAKSAREFVYNLVFNKYVRLENIENEKYGRILADVYIGDIYLNELLLKERYAVKYDGGTKIKPASWLKYKLTGELH
jgi:endonuclease YncB( thermonuclease family)